MASKGEKVLVTGATGYVASHVVNTLLEKGYDVRGTVRSLSNEEKLQPIKSLSRADQHLQLVEADLLNKESILRAVEGCTYVLHVASVFSTDPKDDQATTDSALKGTNHVLEACKAHKVKRLVITSSIVAITGDTGTRPQGWVATEKDWAPEDTKSVYNRSKMQAEKSAWEYVANLDEADKFELAVVNPGFVHGPTFGRGDATSFYFVVQFLEHKIPFLPNLNIGYCDVRDVATAHVAAMTLPEAVGRRFIIVTDNFWLKDVAAILHKEFTKMGYNVPTKTLPSFLFRFLSYFDSMAATIVPLLDVVQKYDTTQMREILGIKATPFEKTIVDMAHSLIQHGIVKKTDKYEPQAKL